MCVVLALWFYVVFTHLFPSRSVAYRQPLLYNLAVTREIIKQIYIREGLQPPSLFAIRSAYASIWSQITSPGLVRNLIRSGQFGPVAVYGLQAYGIFKVRFVSCFPVEIHTPNEIYVFTLDWRNIRALESDWLPPALDFYSSTTLRINEQIIMLLDLFVVQCPLIFHVEPTQTSLISTFSFWTIFTDYLPLDH
jgi:hypothetical protein